MIINDYYNGWRNKTLTTDDLHFEYMPWFVGIVIGNLFSVKQC